jgi:SAM-dependent methyltransferase
LWRTIGRQLRCPAGVAGSMAGRLMAMANRRPNRLAIDALDLAPGDRVLELGFGPGRALAVLAARTPRGQICGVDLSARMLEQAVARNRAAIASGRMRLELGPFSPLRFADETFDKILLVNVVYFFDRDGRDISEVYRVLRFGGRVAIYATGRSSMAKWRFAGPDTHRTFDSGDLRHLLEGAGFHGSRIEVRQVSLPLGIEGILAVAHKEHSSAIGAA